MTSYRFGSRKLFVLKPTAYPDEATQNAPVAGELELEFAYGYNGRDIQWRQNLHLAPTGELIYVLAAVGVVLDPKSGTQKFFFGHNDDITCVAFNPKTGLVATGQVDPKDVPGQGKNMPKIYVWNYKTLEVAQLIDNASWGQVKKVSWGRGKYLYSMGGDDNQSISAWDTADFGRKKDMKPVMFKDTYREEAFGTLCMQTCERKDSVDEIIMFGRRKVCYMYVKESAKKGKKLLEADFKAVGFGDAAGAPKASEKAYLCACSVPGVAQYLVGSPGGYVFLCQGVRALRAYNAHASAVGDIASISESLFLCASFDGTLSCVRLDGTQMSTESTSEKITIAGSDFEMAPRAIAYANKQVYIGSKSNQIVSSDLTGKTTAMVVDGHDDQVWGLCSHSSLPYVCTGGYNNSVKIWNTSTRANTESFRFPEVLRPDGKPEREQVVTCAWSEDGSMIAVGTESSKVALFAFDSNAGPGKQLLLIHLFIIPPKTRNASVEAVSYCRFAQDNSRLAVGHMDSRTYIFDITDKKLVPWKKALSEVAAPSHVQFSADNTMLRVFTRDYEISHWQLDNRTKRGARITTLPDPDVVAWAGDPLIAGWDVQGLYQAEWDGTDLNDACVSGNLIASGDDYGWVRLHNYPAINRDMHRKYQAHSAFVVGTEWTGKGDYLMSVGGNDCAIFQWRLKPLPGKL